MASYYAPKVPPEWMLERIRTDLIVCDDGRLVWTSPKAKTVMVGQTAGWKDENGYIYIRFQRTTNIRETRCLAAHHIVWFLKTGVWPGKEIDHINGHRHDNRIENLRLADRYQQMWNMRRKKRELPTGVERLPAGRFRARIILNGRTVHLGVFDTADEAHQAFMSAALQHRPGFALLEPKDEAA